MLDHHLQQAIVYRLALAPSLRFSELKPDEIESKLFTYHLKKVVLSGLVQKTKSGRYELTSDGRLLGVHVLENNQALADRAYSVLFLIVRQHATGAWLMYKRRSHPLLGKVGFMHATPTSTEKATETARRMCKQKTGLEASFTALGSGFFRVFENTQLESFTNFTLLACEDATGDLVNDDAYAEYYWTERIHVDDKDMLPNMATLARLYQAGEPFFVEQTFQL